MADAPEAVGKAFVALLRENRDLKIEITDLKQERDEAFAVIDDLRTQLDADKERATS